MDTVVLSLYQNLKQVMENQIQEEVVVVVNWMGQMMMEEKVEQDMLL